MALHDPAAMTAAIHAAAARPVRLGETCETFSIADTGGRVTSLGQFDTLADAVDRLSGIHKARFFVRVTDKLTGKVTLKFYQVRKKGRGERRYADYQTRVCHDTYAEHLFDLDGGAL